MQEEKISLEDKKAVISKLRTVSSLLQDIEDSCRKLGIKIPEENIVLKDEEKIKFPSGYIRKIEDFKKRYKFQQEFFPYNMTLSQNLVYALQCSDVFNYFLTRFNIGLSAGRIFNKFAIINIFSIIEGIFYGVVDDLHKFCKPKNCEYIGSCAYYVKSKAKYSFEEVLDLLKERGIFKSNDKIKDLFRSLKGLRDHIHIWDVDENEFLNELYNTKNYNTLVLLLRFLPEYLPEELKIFKIERSHNCKKKHEREK